MQAKKGNKAHALGFKKNGLWYADLPEFLALGLGSKANLLMVDGSDTFLDLLSSNTSKVSVLEYSTF
jgi:prepilin-type processing-associated H-X9-DG protein